MNIQNLIMNKQILTENFDLVTMLYSKAAEHVKSKLWFKPEFMVIAGSGLTDVFPKDSLMGKIAYSEIPEFPCSTVIGHSNEIFFCKINKKFGLIFSGRFHSYEGRTIAEMTASVILSYKLGIRNAIFTNAAGGLSPEKLKIGTIMIIEDIINFTRNSLIYSNTNLHKEYFDRDLRKSIIHALSYSNIPTAEGIYVCMQGPTYETRSEANMLKTFGIDAAGMSTFHEAQVASLLGMKSIGISVITNMLLGIQDISISHDLVLNAAKSAEKSMYTVISKAVELI
jgi:purine-nucleoside phosphorylase